MSLPAYEKSSESIGRSFPELMSIASVCSEIFNRYFSIYDGAQKRWCRKPRRFQRGFIVSPRHAVLIHAAADSFPTHAAVFLSLIRVGTIDSGTGRGGGGHI
jgi:hypothetical protein